MKTTLVIDDTVLAKLKSEARLRRTTISELVEAALRAFLARSKRPAPPPTPLPTFASGGALVDVADRDALYRAMEEER
ncbi:MAG: type II toxin-antitoxin system VapB family antitoxin [Deltaproteobacteria bacterium]|nr:type II toxin-antitoxin system VapB family antitoxin [Deltaproteobacteria bacterium]